MDSVVAPMVLTDKDIIGKVPRCPYRASDDRLKNTFTSLAMLARLLNVSTLLQSYQDLLLSRVSADYDQTLMNEMSQVSRLLTLLHTEMSRACGKSLAGVVLSRRQLWLSVKFSETNMSQLVQKLFLDLPVIPGHVFGPGVDAILEQTAKLQKDRETLQTFMAPPASRTPGQGQWQPKSQSSPWQQRSQFTPRTGRVGLPPKQPRPFLPRQQPQQAQQSGAQQWRHQQGNATQQRQKC